MFRFEDIPADPRDLLKDCELSFLRASGPGGQHRNKVETAVRLVHRPTGVTVVASDLRSQSSNRKAALERLHAKLVRQLKPRKTRKPTRVPKSAKERRLREISSARRRKSCGGSDSRTDNPHPAGSLPSPENYPTLAPSPHAGRDGRRPGWGGAGVRRFALGAAHRHDDRRRSSRTSRRVRHVDRVAPRSSSRHTYASSRRQSGRCSCTTCKTKAPTSRSASPCARRGPSSSQHA